MGQGKMAKDKETCLKEMINRGLVLMGGEPQGMKILCVLSPNPSSNNNKLNTKMKPLKNKNFNPNIKISLQSYKEDRSNQAR